MARSRSESVAINAGAGISMILFTQLSKMILKYVFIITLGAQYNGISTLFGDILSMLSLAEMGIGSAMAYALYKPLAEGNHERIAALMSFYKTAYRWVAGVVLGIGLLLVPFLPQLISKTPDIKENLTLIYLLFLVETASSYLLIYRSTLLSAGQRRYLISGISIAFSIGRTIVQIILLFVFKNYILFLVVQLVETVTRNIVVSRTVDKHHPELHNYPDARLDKQDRKSLFKDVYALFLYKANSKILSSTDSIIIAFALPEGVESVGYLGLYRTIVNVVDSFMTQFYNNLTPSMGNMAVSEPKEKQYSIYVLLRFITFWFACFCSTSLFVLLDPFIHTILGNQYVLSKAILFAVVLDNYIALLLRPIHTVRTANGLFVQGKYRPVATSVVNIALSLALAKPLGVFGILIATCISRLVTVCTYDPYLVYKNVFQMPVWNHIKQALMYFLITAISVAATYFASIYLVTDHSMLNFLIKVSLCLIIPNGIIVLLFRRTNEYKSFMKRLKSLMTKAVNAISRRLKRT